MGREMWEALDGAFPGRTSVVVTRREEYEADGATVAHSPEEALVVARRTAGPGGEVVVAGGSAIYDALLPEADRMYLSRVEAEVEGDTFFPEVDWSEWEAIYELPVDEEDDELPYTFRVLRRIR
jgi:dihydrofolate reductase